MKYHHDDSDAAIKVPTIYRNFRNHMIVIILSEREICLNSHIVEWLWNFFHPDSYDYKTGDGINHHQHKELNRIDDHTEETGRVRGQWLNSQGLVDAMKMGLSKTFSPNNCCGPEAS